MIKIFGRFAITGVGSSYPDNILVFIGHSDSCCTTLMYENSRVRLLFFFFLRQFLVLLLSGVHRYFTIYDDGTLRNITANHFTPIRSRFQILKKSK